MSKQNWTTENIPDLSGKTVIVTGGNSGLGYHAVKAFAKNGATVIMACRNIDKGKTAKQQILESHPSGDITVLELDLADLKSINNFAVKVTKSNTRLDILLNNAGIMMTPYELTKDGFEKQLGTNHLGHFALTGLLLDLLKNTAKSRVVNVSSIAHKKGKIDFTNLQYDNGKNYSPLKAYGQSKLANLLFTYELQRFFETNNIDCSSIAAHPGVSDTNLFNQIAPKWALSLLRPLFSSFVQPASMGVLPELRASVDPEAKGGEFYGPDGKREMKGFPTLAESTPASHDKESARKLWTNSELLTNIRYR